MRKRKTAIALESNKEGLDVFGIEIAEHGIYIKFLGHKSKIENVMNQYFPNKPYTVDKYKYTVPKYILDIDNEYRLEFKL